MPFPGLWSPSSSSPISCSPVHPHHDVQPHCRPQKSTTDQEEEPSKLQIKTIFSLCKLYLKAVVKGIESPQAQQGNSTSGVAVIKLLIKQEEDVSSGVTRSELSLNRISMAMARINSKAIKVRVRKSNTNRGLSCSHPTHHEGKT